MGYTRIYELPKGMRTIEQDEVDALFDRIATSFIANLARYGVGYDRKEIVIE